METLHDWWLAPAADWNGVPLTAGQLATASLLVLVGLPAVVWLATRLARVLHRRTGLDAPHQALLVRWVALAAGVPILIVALHVLGWHLSGPVLGGISLLAMASFVGACALTMVAARILDRVLHHLLARTHLTPWRQDSLRRLVTTLLLVFGLLSCLPIVGLHANSPVLTVGGYGVSVLGLAAFFATMASVLVGSDLASSLVANHLLATSHLDAGARFAIGRLTYYLLLLIGTLVALETIGVALGSLTIILSSLGVGVGFGLQNIVNNFVSGLIILTERPVKVGDVIEVGSTRGRVRTIEARSTTVVTADNIAIIVPNADLVSKEIVNWSFGEPLVRLRLPVGVAYDSDLAVVEEALLSVAGTHDAILSEPAPRVLLVGFGDSALNLELAVWLDAANATLLTLRSDLNFAMLKALREHDVEIPFPQQDVHLRSPLPLPLHGAQAP